MATKIQIKRTTTSNLPSSLDQGEFAYVYDTSNIASSAGDNGGRLYIGDPTSPTNTPIKIGGKYYTDLLDHSTGTLTASAAVIVDASSKIDVWNVDNITIDGNAITSTDTDGDITITPNGNGKTVITNPYVGDSSTTLQEFIEDITGGSVTADNVTLTAVYDDVNGTITLSVKDEGINTTQLADDAVTDAKLKSSATVDSDRAVTTDHIRDNAVTDTKLSSSTTSDADRAVGTNHIKDDAVTQDQIADNAVGTAQIIDSNVTTAKLADNAVTTNKLDTGAVTEGKIATDAVTSTKIADNAVTTNKIMDLNVTTAKLADDAVTAAKIADNAVTATQIADGSITTGKLADDAVTADKIADGVIGTLAIGDGTVTNQKLANSSLTIGTTSIALGDTAANIDGLTSLDVGGLTLETNEIQSVATNGNIVLNPNGTGTVTVPTGYSDRAGFGAQSLVTKNYVDQVASGLDVKESVRVATTQNLASTYDNGTNSDGIGATLTSSTQIALVIDGVTVAQGDRVLVKNQTDNTENGTYVVTATGSNGGANWVLTRSTDGNEPSEIAGGAFFFVTAGTDFGDAGFVATHDGQPTIGTDAITFEQFSGAGQLGAGQGISKVGNLLQVNVDNIMIEVNGSDQLTLKDGGITNDKVSATAAIDASKLNLNDATARSSAVGITQADKGIASFDSNQFAVTNGWATVTNIDGGTYS